MILKTDQKGACLGHVAYFSNFETPNIWNGLRYKPQIFHMEKDMVKNHK